MKQATAREKTYHVTWEIDVDATSPIAAAELAEDILLNKGRQYHLPWRYTVSESVSEFLVEVDEGKGKEI